MTLKEMIARVMRALPAAQPGLIGELDVRDTLNDAQKHLARLSSKPVVWEYELEANLNVIPFPTDMYVLRSVYWESDSVHRELYPDKETLAIDQPDESDKTDAVSAEPTRYYTQGSRILIMPKPTVAGTVRIVYTPAPTEMTEDGDVPDLEGSENYLIAYTLHRFHLEASSPAMQLWEMEKMKEESTWLMTTDQNYRNPFQVDMQW